MEKTLTQVLVDGNDVLLKVNKVGTGQVTGLRKILRNDGMLYEQFSFMTAYSDDFKEQSERVVNGGRKLALIDFSVALTKENIDEIKKTISVAKEAGLQVIVAIPTPKNGLGVPNGELIAFSSKDDLFLELDTTVNQKNNLIKNISNCIANIRDKAFGDNNDPLKPRIK